nr:mucin-3A-like [Aedes albopictus]
MLQYMLFIALLLQWSPVNRCENARSRLDIKHRYSPSHIKLHSPHQHLVSPINLLNPDKYEYFTINNQGNIIKRLMTSKEIQSIVAGNNIKQNVFDRLESPHGIITNIVSSIKNVLNTELLSKHQENQNSEHNVNNNMADVTTYESADKEPEYVPAVLSFEISSPDEDEDNTTDSKDSAVNCPDCNVKQSVTPETTTQLKSTELTTKQTTHHQEERVTEKISTSFEKTTESRPQLLDVTSTEKVTLSSMLSKKPTKPFVEVTEITPSPLDDSSTVAIIMLIKNITKTTEEIPESTPQLLSEIVTDNVENIPILLEENTKEVNHITASTESVPENTPILLTQETEFSTEKVTDNTPMLLEEYTKQVNHLTLATEKETDITPQLLEENVTEAVIRLTEPTEKVTETTTHQPEETTTEFGTTYQANENLLLSFLLNNNLNDQEENPMETTESAQTSTVQHTANELLMSFMLTNNLTESSELPLTDEQFPEKIITFTLPSTLSGIDTFGKTTTQSEESITQTVPASIFTTVDDVPETQFTTKNDYQTKQGTYTNSFDRTTVQESTTELNTHEYTLETDFTKTTVDVQSHIDAFSTLAETTNKLETTTPSVSQTTDGRIQHTTLTADTQNAFYMILELLKDDESSAQQYPQETDSNEALAEEYEDEENEQYSTELFDTTTAQAVTDPIITTNELTTEAPYSILSELFDTTAMPEKYPTTNLVNIMNKVKPTNKVTISWEPSTLETNPPKTTYTTRLTSTVKPFTTSTSAPSTTKLKLSPAKLKPPQSHIVPQPSSNEYVSLAEMILRQSNPAPHANSAEHVDVENLLGLLSVSNKNMTNYVGETATVASVLKPLRKPQPIKNSGAAEHDVFQSFLTITNELKQGVQPASTEDAGNRITSDLFQKLGESEARRNTSFSDQLNSSDMLLTADTQEEFPEESDGISDEDESGEMNNFFKLCNRIGVDMYQSITSQREFDQTKSFSFSPFSAISMMSMLHLGARGKTADQINKLIGLDEMTSFNPHVTFRTISQSIEEENSNSYFVRMLFSDENLGKLQNFFKTKVTQLYSGYAEEISFDDKNMITNRVNLLVNNSTQGAQPQFLEDFQIRAAPPLCLISANSFELGCPMNDESPDIFFHVIDAKGKRRLVDLTAHVYTGSFLFGYNAEMDVTVASIFAEAREISTIFLMPGQQSGSIERNSLLDLENRVFTKTFPAKLKLLEAKLRPQISSVLHIPHLNQQSFVNVSRQLQQLGLGELFRSDSSNLRGIQETTAAPIHMSEFLQINRVSLCDTSVKQKSSEITSSFLNVKSNLKKYYQNTQREHAENVIKLDKPFLYIIRHNPSQLILYVGRFNPVE